MFIIFISQVLKLSTDFLSFSYKIHINKFSNLNFLMTHYGGSQNFTKLPQNFKELFSVDTSQLMMSTEKPTSPKKIRVPIVFTDVNLAS